MTTGKERKKKLKVTCPECFEPYTIVFWEHIGFNGSNCPTCMTWIDPEDLEL